jgi:deoxyribonuclease V
VRATSECGISFSASRAITAQKKLSRLVILRDLVDPSSVRIVVGLDVAYRRHGSKEYAFGVALVYDKTKNRVLDCISAVRRVCVPYIPGLLAFREMTVLGPLAFRVSRRWKPDVMIVDGHGVSHPRRIGIASHIGVATGIPSIGVAKRVLRDLETRGVLKLYAKNRRVQVYVPADKFEKLVKPGAYSYTVEEL